MCRFAVFAGSRELPLSSVLFDTPHSLQRQSYAPTRMLRGHVNVDGAGVAWWGDGHDEPRRHVTTENLWADPNMFDMAQRTSSRHFVAAVRSATPGIPHGAAHVQPFVAEGLAGVHNGWIGGFRGPIGQGLVSRLSPRGFAELTTINDSQVLFQYAADAYRDHGDVVKSLRSALDTVAGAIADTDHSSTLNVALSDGDTVAASRHSIGFDCNSLFVAQRAEGNWLVSEPLDGDSDWVEVPAHHFVTMTDAGVETESL